MCEQLFPMRRWEHGGQNIALLNKMLQGQSRRLGSFVLLIDPNRSIKFFLALKWPNEGKTLGEGTQHWGKQGRTVYCCQHPWLLEGNHRSGGHCPADLRDLSRGESQSRSHSLRNPHRCLGFCSKSLSHSSLVSKSLTFPLLFLLLHWLFLAHLAQVVLRGKVHIPLPFGSA